MNRFLVDGQRQARPPLLEIHLRAVFEPIPVPDVTESGTDSSWSRWDDAAEGLDGVLGGERGFRR